MKYMNWLKIRLLLKIRYKNNKNNIYHEKGHLLRKKIVFFFFFMIKWRSKLKIDYGQIQKN